MQVKILTKFPCHTCIVVPLCLSLPKVGITNFQHGFRMAITLKTPKMFMYILALQPQMKIKTLSIQIAWLHINNYQTMTFAAKLPLSLVRLRVVVVSNLSCTIGSNPLSHMTIHFSERQNMLACIYKRGMIYIIIMLVVMAFCRC